MKQNGKNITDVVTKHHLARRPEEHNPGETWNVDLGLCKFFEKLQKFNAFYA